MTSTPRAGASFAGALVVVAALVLALALVLGGGAPPAAPPGLAGPGRIPAWLGDVAALVARLLGVAAVGLGTLSWAWFGRPQLSRDAAAAAAAWTGVSVLQLGLWAWEHNGETGLFDTPTGRAIGFQAVFAGVAWAGWTVPSSAPGRTLAWPAGVAALLPVVLAGHPRTADHVWLAGTSLGIHVVAAAVWCGGLLALGWLTLTDESWDEVAPRYSAVAAASAALVAASGVVAVLGRLGPDDLFTSRYGAIVLLKAVCLLGLVGAGWLQRRHVVGSGRRRWRGFVALAGTELVTMAVVFGLAVALSRTPPPVG